jgi:hypothetical protein
MGSVSGSHVGLVKDTSVSPANPHTTCSAFVNHTIIDTYEVSKLTASINIQFETDMQKNDLDFLILCE